MFDSHNYRTTEQDQMSAAAAAFCPELKYVSIMMLFPLLVEIIPVQHLFDGEGRGNDKAPGVRRSLKCLPKLPRTHLHHHGAAPAENTFVGSNSVFHHAPIQLASLIWAGHYSWSRTKRQFDVCQALRNLIEHIDAPQSTPRQSPE